MRYHIVKQSRGYRGGFIAEETGMDGFILIRTTLEDAIKICDIMSEHNPVGYEVHEEKEFDGIYSHPVYVYQFKK